MDEYDIQDLYLWIDELPLSRPKRNITRDFSDGVRGSACIACTCEPTLARAVADRPRGVVARVVRQRWRLERRSMYVVMCLSVDRVCA